MPRHAHAAARTPLLHAHVRTLLLPPLALAAAAAPAQDAPSEGPNRSLLRPSAGAARAGGPVAEAFARARDAVVHVYVEVAGDTTFKLERPSSGALLSRDGLVLTWWDLVREGFADDDDDKTVRVSLRDGRSFPATLAARDERSGTALLQVDPAAGPLPALEFRGDGRAAPGEDVGLLAFHDGEESVGFAGIATPALGPVRLGEGDGAPLLDPDGILATDAAIQPRCHGAPLVDADGAFAGLCNAARVVGRVEEPTLEQILAPNDGFVLPSDAVWAAYPALASRAVRAGTPAASAGRSAWQGAHRAVVGVLAGAPQPLPADDPFATTRRAGIGSGVVLDAEGRVLTNLHLVEDADALRVRLQDGRTLEATLSATDRTTNTAVLQIEAAAATSLPAPIRCGSSDALRIGEPVFALGMPDGTRPLITAGVLSARRRVGTRARLQVDTRLGNGLAGGPLVDARGYLVGLVDGGPEDPRVVAFQRRGDRAKVETSLNLTPGLDALRPRLGDVIPEAEGDAAESAGGGLAATVDQVAGAMLNIYIERVVEVSGGASDNPFAPTTTRSFPISLGSGVVVDRSGLAVTNWHVVDAATLPDGRPRDDHEVTATRFDGRRFDADVLSISREDDLALLRLRLDEGERVQAVELGTTSDLVVGDRAFAVGNPEGRANTITAGIVSALGQSIRVRNRFRDLEPLIETDAAINSGNSGGALLDGAGRLIGINSAGGSGFAVTGYAIEVDHVREQVLGILLGSYKLRSIYTGMEWKDRDDGAVVVGDVDPDGPAARAGIGTGDRLVRVDGEDVVWSVGLKLRLVGREATPLELVVERRSGGREELRLVPLPHLARVVERQIGAEVGLETYAASPELVREAARGLEKAFTGDPDAEPGRIPPTLIRVDRLAPAGADSEASAGGDTLRVGDLLLGIELERRGAAATARTLIPFRTLREVVDTFQMHALYDDGRTFDAWIHRDGRVQRIRLRARKLLP